MIWNWNNFDARNIIDQLIEGVYLLDQNKQIIYSNSGAETITGYASDEVMGKCNCSTILAHIDDKGNKLCEYGCPVTQTLSDGQIRSLAVYFRHKEGYRVPVTVKIMPLKNKDNQIVAAAEIFQVRVNDEMWTQEVERLRDVAMLDCLTGQKNRGFGEIAIKSRLLSLQSGNISFSVLFFDIDHFKAVNDTFGHPAGDKVLQVVAKSIANNIRTEDVLIRWGGEEFIVLLGGYHSGTTLEKIANKLRMLIEQSSITFDGQCIKVTVSGGATMALVSDSMEVLIRRADELMYESKRSGRNRITVG